MQTLDQLPEKFCKNSWLQHRFSHFLGLSLPPYLAFGLPDIPLPYLDVIISHVIPQEWLCDIVGIAAETVCFVRFESLEIQILVQRLTQRTQVLGGVENSNLSLTEAL
ncbi:hypothetical protein Tco_0365432 [Tanacetum coccineum]